MEDVITLMKNHRSVRSFLSQPVEPQLLENLVLAGQSASTSHMIQAYTVIRVTDTSARERLATLCGGQDYVRTAAEFLVFCADLKRLKLACEIQETEMMAGYTEHFVMATVDCALFAQNVMLAAESEGLGGVYIGGIRNEIAAVTELLELPELVYPVFGMCLGYPDSPAECKPRLPLSAVLRENSYPDPGAEAALQDYDRTMREYYQRRSSNSKEQGWTDQMADFMSREARPHMYDYLRRQGFLRS